MLSILHPHHAIACSSVILHCNINMNSIAFKERSTQSCLHRILPESFVLEHVIRSIEKTQDKPSKKQQRPLNHYNSVLWFQRVWPRQDIYGYLRSFALLCAYAEAQEISTLLSRLSPLSFRRPPKSPFRPGHGF